MLCTPISQSPQHRAVEAALSSSKIAFTLQIASLQRLYRSFCPVWFCTYFASTSIYHGNMTLQCPGVGGRGRSPLIRNMMSCRNSLKSRIDQSRNHAFVKKMGARLNLQRSPFFCPACGQPWRHRCPAPMVRSFRSQLRFSFKNKCPQCPC